MNPRSIPLLAAAAAGLAACSTAGGIPPAEAIRYHLGSPARGTVAVLPAVEPGVPPRADPGLEYRAYADAVGAELARNGYPPVAADTQPEFIASVAYRRGVQYGPPRSNFSIGLGGGGFSGGRGGGVGLGGGVGIPVGGGRGREIVTSELMVTIKRRVDQSPIWEGQARAAADGKRPEADTPALAQRLAAALFSGFPGESGRTVEIR